MFLKKWLIGLFLVGIGINAMAVEPVTSNTATVTDPSQAIMVSQTSPEVTITLASNPTTGYSWLLSKYDAEYITLVKHYYRPPASAMMGAGGTEQWIFKVSPNAFVAPRTLNIGLVYARPWNLKDQSRKIEFKVVTH